MPDSKITALTSISTSTDPANDPLVIVDVSDTSMAATGTTKKVTLNQLLGASGTATLASATITGDLTVRTNKLQVTSTGVGIGGASAAYPLEINGGASASTSQFKSSSASVITRFTDGTGETGYVGSGISLMSGISRTDFGIASNGALVFGVSTGLAMTLNSTGLGVGVSPAASSKIHTLGNGNNVYAVFQNGDTLATNKTSQLWLSNGPTFLGANNREYRIVNLGTSATASDLVFDYWTGSAIAERMRIDSSGNLGIGVTPSYKLHVAGTGYFSSTLTLDGATRLAGAGSNSLNFNTNSVDRVTIDGSGNTIVTTTATAPSLGTARQMVFNLTSDTNLRISVRGTDGTTRTANITLA